MFWMFSEKKSKFWNSELVNRLWSRPARGRTCPVRPDHTRRERFEINWTDWTTLWRHLTCRNHLRNPPKPNTTRHKSIEKYWNLENSQFTKLNYERFLPPVTKWSLPPKTCCPIRYKNRHPMVRSDVICEKTCPFGLGSFEFKWRPFQRRSQSGRSTKANGEYKITW